VPTEAPEPRPGPGEVVVNAAACDVMFVDVMIRSGRGVDFFPTRPPYVPGNGVGGEVVAVGDGVDKSWLGRRVIAHTGGPGGTGGYAELAVANLEYVLDVPDGVEMIDAIAIIHDGPTALLITDVVGSRAGKWALVLGAAGGITVRVIWDIQMGPGERAGLAKRLLPELASGRVTPLVGQTFPSTMPSRLIRRSKRGTQLRKPCSSHADNVRLGRR
jgi:D-arabinose 1-dehydrogenase-like Zn-dependent alcohol dehydrogenase